MFTIQKSTNIKILQVTEAVTVQGLHIGKLVFTVYETPRAKFASVSLSKTSFFFVCFCAVFTKSCKVEEFISSDLDGIFWAEQLFQINGNEFVPEESSVIVYELKYSDNVCSKKQAQLSTNITCKIRRLVSFQSHFRLILVSFKSYFSTFQSH